MDLSIPAAKQPNRPFTLVTYDREWKVLKTQYSRSASELLRALSHEYEAATRSTWNSTVLGCFSGNAGHVRVFNYRGKELAVDELAVWAEHWIRWTWWIRRSQVQPSSLYEHRRTPVPGIIKGHTWHKGDRHPAVLQTIRTQACVLTEEGEMPFRGATRVILDRLTDRWEDPWRREERCWKAQHKGRKAWDKPRLAR